MMASLNDRNWICPKVPISLKKHPRYIHLQTLSQSNQPIDQSQALVCMVTGVYSPLMHPSQFAQEFGRIDAEYLSNHLLADIEQALSKQCNHHGPHLLLSLIKLATDEGNLLFYPCEAVNLLGQEEGLRVLKSLMVECQQVLEEIDEADSSVSG